MDPTLLDGHSFQIDWGYVAGYFDGEGSAGVYGKGRGGWSISWCNSHLPSLEAIQAFIGAGHINRRKGTNMPVYQLRVRRVDDLQRIVPELLPRCPIKHEALVVVLGAVEGKRSSKYGCIERYGEAKVLDQYASGLSMANIAGLIGVDTSAVRSFLVTREIPLRERGESMSLMYQRGGWRDGATPLAKAGPAAVRKLYWEDQLTIAEVADHFGVALRSVAAFMSRHGVPTRTQSEAARQRRSHKPTQSSS